MMPQLASLLVMAGSQSSVSADDIEVHEMATIPSTA
jgi:hypothetical protein